MKFLIGEKEFESKKSAKEFISGYLKNNLIIDQENEKWILELLMMHPRWTEKSKNMEKIIIKKTLKGDHAFHLIKDNGEIEDISYIKCFNGENSNELLNKALRFEIDTQITEFRRKTFNSGETINCELCSKRLQNDKNSHIDHVKKFKEIVAEFLILEPFIETKSIGCGRVLVDERIKKRWHEFHKKHAILRPLCWKCNLKKK